MWRKSYSTFKNKRTGERLAIGTGAEDGTKIIVMVIY